jgi:hypothetical protein
MDIKKSFGLDADAANHGKWFDLEDGGRVKVAKFNNPLHRAEITRLQKPHLATLRSGVDTTDLVNDITVKAMARHILVGWDGLTLDGENIDYSPEKAEELLKSFPEFREAVAAISIDRRAYAPEEITGK